MYISLNELTERISLVRAVTENDEEGNLLATGTEPILTTWAKVLPYTAKISDGYMENVNEVNYRVVIRYREGIQVTDVVKWNGKKLQLNAPPYGMNGKKRWLVLECKELVEDG